jgi:hypothetical protein
MEDIMIFQLLMATDEDAAADADADASLRTFLDMEGWKYDLTNNNASLI